MNGAPDKDRDKAPHKARDKDRDKAKPKVLCLAGPTASGKTDIALQLAERYPLRLISVDSAQVYRGMDIGTGKPDAATLARTPHRLVDIRDPAQAYSAADFRRDAEAAVREAWAEGRLPLLVGGTMLYFKALRDGLTVLPEADPAVRARIEAMAAAEGWAAVHARLQAADPASAARIHPNDPQRLQRALEVFMVTGRPLSEFHQADARGETKGGPEQSPPTRSTAGEALVSRAPPQGGSDYSDLPKDTPPFALEFHIILPEDRAALHRRIAERFQAMLAQGLIDEVRGLRERGDLHPGLPALKSVGYRQVWQYLEGRLSRQEMEQAAIAATRQLAKRQLTWLRGWPGRSGPATAVGGNLSLEISRRTAI